jgi:putative cell wall-binding protein
VAAAVVGAGVLLAPSAAHAAANTVVNDAYTTHSGVAFSAAAAVGLLANDVEVTPGAIASVTSDPLHGLVSSFSDDGSFSYTATAGFTGDDTFTYCIKTAEGQPCASLMATVTLHVTSSIERIGGADRYVVSAAISAEQFAPRKPTVYVASGENFPDALSASAAAGAFGAPVLLVAKDSVPSAIAGELTRLKPENIILLGGTNSVSNAVETRLHDFVGGAGSVTRVSGATRYDVSATISQMTFAKARPVAYIASGEGFADALSGSAAAGALGGPVLLVQKDAIPSAVANELARLVPGKIVVLGGANTISDSVVATLQKTAVTSRASGVNRFATSAKVSQGAFMPTDTNTVFISSGETFPDALSGGASAIANHAPVLLVSKNSISADVAAEIGRLKPTRIIVLGGTNAVSDGVYEQLKSLLR